MRIRSSLAAVAAVATLGIAGAVPAMASPVHPDAATVLTTGSAGGTAVAAGDILMAPLEAGTNATFFSSATGTSGVTCAVSKFTDQVLTNPTAPGTATESLTGQTFSSCTSNVTGVTGVQSITVNNLPYNTTVSDSTGDPVVVSAASATIQTTVVLNTLLGTTTCVYTGGPLNGNASNAANTISFANQHFTKSTGSSLCFADAFFTAAYGPVTDTTQGGAPVFVN